MATFDFPYFTYSTENPDSAVRVKMGNSYTYSAPPSAPDQRVFKLKFAAMQYFTTNGVIDLVKNPKINLARLEQFYDTHKTHLRFDFNHPVYGPLVCSFSRPISIPHGDPGGNGVVLNIEVELLEHPGRSVSASTDMIQIEYRDFP